MTLTLPRRFLRLDVGIAIGTLALLMLWPSLLGNFFASSFMPHGHCYLWQPSLVWLHFGTDLSIGLAYVVISATLVYIVRSLRKDLPFSGMMLAFGMFIIACGGTHLVAVWTLWKPYYWVSGSVKLVTAVASVATAVALPRVVPRLRSLVRAENVAEDRRRDLEVAHRELEKLYEQLRELDALKSRFFANVSHEFRTPLALILGLSRQLEEGARDEQQRHDLRTIQDGARGLTKLVDDILELSTLDAGQLHLDARPTDLTSLLHLVASPFATLAPNRDIDFRVDAPERLPARLDTDKVQRMLVNLLSNAFKFTPSGGRVELSLRDDGEWAKIEVRDSGPGIPEELRSQIFERFQQADGSTRRRHGGTGLGLAIVRELAEMHGGGVSVDDAPDGGARFTLELPLAAAPSEHRAEDAESTASAAASAADAPRASETALQAVAGLRLEGPAARGKEPAAREEAAGAESAAAAPRPAPAGDAAEAVDERAKLPLALVVEDSPEMRRFIDRALSRRFRVALASDGREGLRAAAELRPDVVVTDLMMPEMSGIDLLQELKDDSTLASVPVLVLTARADDTTRHELLEKGAHDYMTKPFSVKELRARVENLAEVARTRRLLQGELASRSQELESLATELISRRRQAEEANRLKDEFLAVVSHELRSPLTAVVGWVRLMRTKELDEKTTEQALEAIDRNVSSQTQIIEDLLDVSRIVTGRLKVERSPLDVGAVISSAVDTVRPAAEARAISIRLETPDGLRTVGDPERLQQVFWNLVSNAVKFSPDGSTVRIVAERAGQRARVRVEDRGRGIDPDFLPHVFETFRQQEGGTTRRQGGLGLGLAIVKHLVELHGGTVTAQSEGEDRGTSFTVELPIADSAIDVLPAREREARPGALDGLRLLLVDDSRDARDVLRTVLSSSGAEVRTASSVDEALRALEDGRPDVLISDLGMPHRDGYELIREVRRREAEQEGPRLPGMALSAHVRQDDRESSAAAGFDAHLGKPADPAELCEAVARLAGRR